GIRQAGEVHPLRASPGAVAVPKGAEHQLGDAGGQQPEAFLARAQLLVGLMPLGPVANYLDEAGGTPVLQHPHHQAGAPEALARAAHMPALVLRTPLLQGARPLELRLAGSPVL